MFNIEKIKGKFTNKSKLTIMETNFNNEELRKFCNYLIQTNINGIKKEDENIIQISKLLNIDKDDVLEILRFLNKHQAILFKNGLGPNWIINEEKCSQILHSLSK